MKLRTPEDILAAHKEVYDSEDDLHIRMEADYALFRGEKDPTLDKKGYSIYTDNAPQTLADKTIDILSKAIVTLRIPIVTQLELERKTESMSERFVDGCRHEIDKRFTRLAMPSLQQQLAWHAVLRGWIVGWPRIYKSINPDNPTTIECDVWDRRWTTYEMGKDSVEWACYEQVMSARRANYIYGTEFHDKAVVSIYHFIDNEVHAVIINDQFYKDPEPHGFKRCPVIIVPVGATPLVSSEDYTDTIKDFGESIYANNRNMYPPFNRVMTDMLRMVERGGEPPMKIYSRTGETGIEGDPMKAKQKIQLSTENQEEVKPVEQPVPPVETMPLVSMLGAKIQQGGLPASVFGDIGFTLSALAISYLNSATGSIVDRRARALQAFYEEMAFSLCEQFAQGGLKPLEMMAKADKKTIELVKFSPEMVKPYNFQAVIDMKLPQDEVAKWQIINMARMGDVPFLSDQTLMEKYADVEDPDLELEKKFEEQARRNPSIITRQIMRALINRGRPDLAYEVLMDYMDISQQKAMKRSMAGVPMPPNMNPNMPSQGTPPPMGQPAPTQASPPVNMPTGA